MKFIKIIIIWGLFYMCSAQAGDMPQETTDLENAFKSVPGVTKASIGKHKFSNDNIKELDKLFFGGVYADLPIAMLRRSNGTSNNEILIFIDFEIELNKKGLKALEFFSWWVRDLSRSGHNVQIRSIALPPIIGKNVQLGKTLRFWFEAYILTEKPDMKLVLHKVGELAESLNSNFKDYKSAF